MKDNFNLIIGNSDFRFRNDDKKTIKIQFGLPTSYYTSDSTSLLELTGSEYREQRYETF